MGGEYDLAIIDYIAQIITPKQTPPSYSEIGEISTNNQISHQGSVGSVCHPPPLCVVTFGNRTVQLPLRYLSLAGPRYGRNELGGDRTDLCGGQATGNRI